MWWLLVFRARTKLISSQLDVENTISYFIPSFIAEAEEERRKCALLESYDVNVRILDTSSHDWWGFYEKALAEITNRSPTTT